MVVSADAVVGDSIGIDKYLVNHKPSHKHYL